jgi:RNA polymerase sigma-70 factor (ECF subfamily)
VDEAEVIERCRRGEPDARRELYEQYSERIYRLALRTMRNADDAFDVTQDAFVRAFAGIESFDGRSGLGTWLYRIAVNEALQRLRRRRIEQKHLKLLEREAQSHQPRNSDVDGPDLEAALAELSDQARTILLLKYQEGLDYARIAQALGCAAGTVASRLSRARDQLRQLLENPARGGEESVRSRHPNKGDGSAADPQERASG